MSRIGMPAGFVGNDFVVQQPRMQVVSPIPVVMPLETPQVIPVTTLTAAHPKAYEPAAHSVSIFHRGLDLLHDHSLIAFSLLFLLVGSTGIDVFGSYRASAIQAAAKPAITAPVQAPAIAGLNMTVPANELDARVQTIINQSATLAVGDQTDAISPDTIKSWLAIVPSKDKATSSIHINAAKIAASVTELAKKYEKAPVNEVTSTAGGASAVIATGKNGAKLTDPSTITAQASVIAKTLLDAKGMQFSTPLETVPFASVTPAAFPKLIEINVNSKQMYLYDNGQLTHSYPISAGAAETPTPIGQYKIFSKLAVQDMKGFNPNGTKYFQPHVRWVNYFLPGGYAIHGNYWRPQSWFGVINSSHGCASLPDAQAEEVYNWAPMGTPVITHR